MTTRATTTLVGLCCGMLLWAGVASAGERCRQIEYAELKDMSTMALRHLWCDDFRAILILQNAAVYAANSYDWPAVVRFRREAEECDDMTDKINTVFRARGLLGVWDPCDFTKEPKEGQR